MTYTIIAYILIAIIFIFQGKTLFSYQFGVRSLLINMLQLIFLLIIIGVALYVK